MDASLPAGGHCVSHHSDEAADQTSETPVCSRLKNSDRSQHEDQQPVGTQSEHEKTEHSDDGQTSNQEDNKQQTADVNPGTEDVERFNLEEEPQKQDGEKAGGGLQEEEEEPMEKMSDEESDSKQEDEDKNVDEKLQGKKTEEGHTKEEVMEKEREPEEMELQRTSGEGEVREECEDESESVENLTNDSSCEKPMDVDNQDERMQEDAETSLNTAETPVASDLKHSNEPDEETSAMEETEKTTPPSPAPLMLKIKDEPMDEEYEKALAPQATPEKVKDEPVVPEESAQKTAEMIKISAVFSVGPNSSPLSSTMGSPVAASMANPPSSPSLPTVSPANSLCVVCSGCKKLLLKGQTAFQRKGSPQLFCSPRCLCSSSSSSKTEVVGMSGAKKSCHCCNKDILNHMDSVSAQVDSSRTMKNFCSQKCLSVFNNRRDKTDLIPETDSKCSICQKVCMSKHEVNFMGRIQKMCSNTCFQQFCASNKLTMNCCSQCGRCCYKTNTKCSALVIEGTVKKFCCQHCFTMYKKKYTKTLSCAMCRVFRSISEMIESPNLDGNLEMFCSSACVTAHKVQKISSSGASLECNHCKQISVPQYHLAMSDNSFRTFCSFSCVVAFQEAFNKTNSQSNQLNVALPFGAAQSTTQSKSSDTAVSGPAEATSSGTVVVPTNTKLPCSQCMRLFHNKPELLEFKSKMYLFCDKPCIDEFRRAKYIMALCVYCKLEKVVKEVKRINNMDCFFCSEGCKLLYKHDLVKSWGRKHCRNCLYCGSTTHTVVSSAFAGKQEEFCSNECLSQYTLLFCEVAKCSMCKRAAKMTESVKWLGEMKHFCNVLCLLYYCSLYSDRATTAKPAVKSGKSVPITIAPAITPTSRSPSTGKETSPVIANVISLSNTPNGQPSVPASAALQGSVPNAAKLLGNASTQTESVRTPAAPPRLLKNKALLCKPMTQTKGTSCKPNTSDMDTQTDDVLNRVLVLPVPVPVFLPVPMHLYTQCTPHPVGLPLPVPVPMFLPVTVENAERLVETIQEIKEKIPVNPLEADLIMMAEMVAEDSEKEKTGLHEDQDDQFMEDFDLEALSSQLSWEEDSVSSASRWGRSSEGEKAAPSKQGQRSPSPPPEEPVMDLEADFPVESFEQEAQNEKTSPTMKSKTRKKSRETYLPKKRTRKRSSAASSLKVFSPHGSRLHNEYGVQTWKSWIRWRNTRPEMETPKIGSRSIVLKEDLLQSSTAELSYGLSKFVAEVRRPNGEEYSTDSIYYLCLGIQQYLFENGRMENIFADVFYTKFSQTISSILKDWKPTILPSGYVHSRVEEEYLWECKQLGAFSPSVLLNTLIYFFTKYFNFKTVAQHRRLSFAHIIRCTRTNSSGSKRSCLRFYPPVNKDKKSSSKSISADVSTKRKRDELEADGEGVVLEMHENSNNPLRCPVRLYEFYLSKCSSSVKQRTTVFFLRPERSCVPNSPLWFSSVSLDDEELENMLARILTVREIHMEREKPAAMSGSDAQTDSD